MALMRLVRKQKAHLFVLFTIIADGITEKSAQSIIHSNAFLSSLKLISPDISCI